MTLGALRTDGPRIAKGSTIGRPCGSGHSRAS